MTETVYRNQAEQIATALGGTLADHPYGEDHRNLFAILLPGATSVQEGPALTLRYDPWNRDGKIAVDGWYPKYADGQVAITCRSWDELPSINVSHSKTAEQIAKDITRRLLPDYLALHAQTVERIDAQNKRQQAQRATRDRLAACFHKDVSAPNWKPQDYQNRSLRYYGSDGTTVDIEIAHDGESVYAFNIRNLTIEQAEQIARLIATA